MTVSNCQPEDHRQSRSGAGCAPLWRALALSLLVHLAVLLGVWPHLPPNEPAAGRPSPRLVAAFGAQVAAAPGRADPAPAAMPSRPPADIARPSPTPLPSEPAPVIAAPAADARAVEGRPILAAPEPSRLSADDAGAAQRGPATGGAAGPAPDVLVGGAGPLPAGPDPSLLAAYRQALVQAAIGFKRYPPLARERGWEGTVELSIVLLPRHSTPVVRVSRGSGFGLLDEQALDMMARAVRRLPVPEALQSMRAEFALPIRFELGE